MARTNPIRNVPDSLHRALKSRAALEGKSLSAYLLGDLTRFSERPTMWEWRQRLATRASVVLNKTSPASIIRDQREAGDCS